MATTERLRTRGTLRGRKWLNLLATQFRDARLALALSQQAVADAVGIDRATYCLIEHVKYEQLSIVTAARIAAVVGLDMYVALYPGKGGLRDAATAARLNYLLGQAAPPLRTRTEVPLATTSDRPEQRSWDGMLTGDGRRTGIELEMRLYDAQDQTRRHNLKRSDDPVDGYLLVIADTRRNREVLAMYPGLFADLPRLRTADVLKKLRAGQHPPTGLILLGPPPKMKAAPNTDDADLAAYVPLMADLGPGGCRARAPQPPTAPPSEPTRR